jgi:hypothetical protein
MKMQFTSGSWHHDSNELHKLHVLQTLLTFSAVPSLIMQSTHSTMTLNSLSHNLMAMDLKLWFWVWQRKQDWSRWWSKSNLQVLVFCIITCNIPMRNTQFYFIITKEYHIHNRFQCAIQHTNTTFFLGEIGSYLLVSFFFLLVVLVLMNQWLKYKFESFAKE